jgi:hypothetical protein
MLLAESLRSQVEANERMADRADRRAYHPGSHAEHAECDRAHIVPPWLVSLGCILVASLVFVPATWHSLRAMRQGGGHQHTVSLFGDKTRLASAQSAVSGPGRQ